MEHLINIQYEAPPKWLSDIVLWEEPEIGILLNDEKLVILNSLNDCYSFTTTSKVLQMKMKVAENVVVTQVFRITQSAYTLRLKPNYRIALPAVLILTYCIGFIVGIGPLLAISGDPNFLPILRLYFLILFVILLFWLSRLPRRFWQTAFHPINSQVSGEDNTVVKRT